MWLDYSHIALVLLATGLVIAGAFYSVWSQSRSKSAANSERAVKPSETVRLLSKHDADLAVSEPRRRHQSSESSPPSSRSPSPASVYFPKPQTKHGGDPQPGAATEPRKPRPDPLQHQMKHVKKKTKKKKLRTSKQESNPNVMDTCMALAFVLCGSLMLVTLYFFYSYLIYAILVLYCFSGTHSITTLLSPALQYLSPSPKASVGPFCGDPSCKVKVSSLLAFLLGVSCSATWFFFRREIWSWVPQDIMCMAILITIQTEWVLPNIRIATLFMGMVFLYDIFWVFGSTHILSAVGSSDTTSVMEVVASGGDTGEMLPYLILVPQSYGSFHILGLGDVMLPGMLVSFLCRYGTRKKELGWTSYFWLAVYGYAAGMFLTFIALSYSRTAQPALLYLVPCTLGTTILYSWCRGELRYLWDGQPAHLAMDGPLQEGNLERNARDGRQVPELSGVE